MLGNQINWFIRLCFLEQQLGHFALFGSVNSFRVGIIQCCFFWVPYYVRNVLKKFEICSQPAQPVGELDQPVH